MYPFHEISDLKMIRAYSRIIP